MSKINQLIKYNSRRAGIDYGQGEEVWMMMWRFVRDSIGEGEILPEKEFKSVFIKYLGTFHPNYKQIEKLREVFEEYEKKKELDENI